MSVTPVKIGGNGSTTAGQSTIAAALTTSASAGDDVWAMFVAGGGKTVSSVTDSQGNTWTVDATVTKGTVVSVSICHSKLTTGLVAGTDTITATLSGTTARTGYSVAKVASGGMASSPFDQAATSTGTTTAVSVGPTGTLAQADELTFLAVGANEGGVAGLTISPGGSLTALDTERSEAGTNDYVTWWAWEETASTAALTPTGTFSAAPNGWAGAVATYKVAGSTTDHGTGTSTSASSGSATGVVTKNGSGSSASASSGHASGVLTKNGTASSVSASHGAASGVDTRHGTAASTSASAGSATGTAGGGTIIHGTAASVSASHGSAAGRLQASASSASASSGHASGTRTIHGTAASVSASAGLATVASPGWHIEAGWDRGAGLFIIGQSKIAGTTTAPSPTIIGDGSNSGADTLVAASLTAGAGVGETVVAIMAWAAQTVVTGACTDTKGNVWQVYPDTLENPSHAVCISTLAHALTSSDTITLQLTKSDGHSAVAVGGRLYSVASYGTGLVSPPVDAVVHTSALGTAISVESGALGQAVEVAILVASWDSTIAGSDSLTGLAAGWTRRDQLNHPTLARKYLAWADYATSANDPVTAVATLGDGGDVAAVSLFTLRCASTGGGVGDVLAGPYSEPTWSDITSQVQLLHANRGRQDALSAIQAGTVDLTLIDESGTYNPKNTASPLYGKVLPKVPVRARYTWDNGDGTFTDHYLYRGYIREVVGPSSKHQPYSTISCVDLLEEMSVERPVIGSTGETTTGGAIAAILDAFQYPTSKRSLMVGDPVADFSLDGTVDLLTAIGNLLQAEGGSFFFAADGTATYVDHGGSQTLVETISVSNMLAPGVTLDNLVTQATVIRTDAAGNQGAAQTYSDPTALQLFGARRPKTDPLVTPYPVNDAQALSLAERFVVMGKDPRSPVWSLVLMRDSATSANFKTMLQRDLGDRVSVNDTESGAAGDYTIEGIQHDVSDGTLNHVTTWTLRERPSGLFIIGQSVIESLDVLAA